MHFGAGEENGIIQVEGSMLFQNIQKIWISDGQDQDWEVETETETFILNEVLWDRDFFEKFGKHMNSIFKNKTASTYYMPKFYWSMKALWLPFLQTEIER